MIHRTGQAGVRQGNSSGRRVAKNLARGGSSVPKASAALERATIGICTRIETVLSRELATARSTLPSRLKSAATTARGETGHCNKLLLWGTS